MKVQQAIELATRFHEGATDQAGKPYVNHVLRVADRVDGHDEKLAALLHDLLEDTSLTSTDLRSAGCPPQVVLAVEALTRAPQESYEDFVHRAASNELARVVKLADVADNADEERLALLDKKTADRLRRKYHRAREILLEDQMVEGDKSLGEFESEFAEIGLPEEKGEQWVTFWCRICDHPAGTLELIKREAPDLVFEPGYHLQLQCFLGSMGPSIAQEDLAEVLAALKAEDAWFFFNLNSELTPFWCPICAATYCGAHTEVETLFDDGFFDAFYGTCPEGHRRELWD